MAQSLTHTIISANAGSGKTQAITDRILSLLFLGESPARILATTFTRKAAGEILERLLTRLVRATHDETALEGIRNTLVRSDITVNTCRAVIRRIIDEQYLLRIYTLDSFFNRMCKLFGAELGFPQDWHVTDESEESFLVSEALSEFLKQGDEKEFIDLISDFYPNGAMTTIGRIFTDSIKKLPHVLLDVLSDRETLVSLTVSDTEIPQIDAIAEFFENIQAPITKSGEPSKKWDELLSSIRESIRNRNILDAVNHDRWEQFCKGNWSYYKIEASPEIVTALQHLLDAARRIARYELIHQTKTRVEIARRFLQHILTVKLREGRLSFLDIQCFLHSRLRGRSLDEIYYRLDALVKHLLLDEFQDTSREQWEIISPLADEITARFQTEGSFLCVGDPKQAIYGWRGGEVKLFSELSSHNPHFDKRVLDTTYRCAPAVTEAVNQLFCSILQNSALSSEPEATKQFAEQFEVHKAHERRKQGFVKIQKLSEQEEMVHDSFFEAAYKIQEISNRRPDLSIGVLFETNDDIQKMSELLSQMHVKHSEEGKSPIETIPMVQATLSALRFADHPSDTLARYHLSLTPLAAIIKLEDWKDDSKASSCSRALRESFMSNGFGFTVATWVRATIGSYQKYELPAASILIDEALKFPYEKHLNCSRFIERVLHLKKEKLLQSNVRLLTIHKSKGLEFDVVILPELGRDILNSFRRTAFISQRDADGKNSIIRYPNRTIALLDVEARAIKERAQISYVYEALCKLYVAMTRARFATYIYINDNAAKLSLARIVENHFLKEGILSCFTLGEEFVYEEKDLPSSKEASPLLQFDLKSSLSQRGASLLSPSTMLPTLVTLGNILSVGSIETIAAGISTHRRLSEIQWLEDQEVNDLVNPSIKEIMTKHFYEEQYPGCSISVATERRFCVKIEGKVLYGAFDRLIVGKKEGRTIFAEVIDFKTDNVPKAAVKQRIQNYRPQMEAYRRAASEITKVPLNQISVKLVFLTPAVIETVE